MIQITPQMRLLVAIEPVHGRKGIDSLARLCSRRTQDGGRQAIPRTRRSGAFFRMERPGIEPAWAPTASHGNE